MDHDDLLVPQALQEVVTVIERTGADFVYTDEGFLQEDENGSSISYHFKPDFALDTLRAVNYICHFSVIRRDLLEQVGMFRGEFDGSQDHDLFLRLAGCAERIEHIPKVLYLWRSHTASVSKNSNTSSYVADAAKRAVLEHLRQQGIVAAIQTTAFKINYDIIGNPMVLIAIRHNGLVKETARCIDAIVKRSLYENYELAVWNASCHTQEEQEYFELLKECKNIHVVNGYIVGAGKDGVAMASHEGAGAFSTGYIQRLYFAQNVSALSDKMLMVKAELFQKTGGFDRTLTLHYAAIDFCLKLREPGLVNIVNPYGGSVL